MTDDKLAVLIDADNVPYSIVKEMMEEISKNGTPTIKRIYADWTKPTVSGWKNILLENAITPIQQYSYTSGKNSSDSALIIDAMDILYSKNVDGFCIVSSDSDYTGLAKRIREEGLFVMGIGRRTTPIAFVNSCEIFTFTENLSSDSEMMEDETEVKKVTVTDSSPKKSVPKAVEKAEAKSEKKMILPKHVLRIIDKAFEISINEEDEAYIAKVGSSLRKIDPSFDSRTYGFKTLTKLFESLDKYAIVKNEVNGLNHPLVKLK